MKTYSCLCCLLLQLCLQAAATKATVSQELAQSHEEAFDEVADASTLSAVMEDAEVDSDVDLDVGSVSSSANSTTQGCANTHGMKVDANSADCSSYTKDDCGTADTADFSSSSMCCVCGGGENVDAVKSGGQFDLVISTLQDICKDIDNATALEAAAMTKYEAWCDSQKQGLQASIEFTQDKTSQAFVTVEELTATIATLTHAVATIQSDMKKLQDDQDQMTNIRQEEKMQYTEEANLNTNSERTVTNALGALTKSDNSGAFLQQRSKHGFAPNVDYVTGLLKGIRDRLVSTRKQIDDVEAAKATTHTELFSAKQDQLTNLKTEVLDKGKLLADGKLDLVEAQRIHDEGQASIVDMNKMLDDIGGECTAQVADYTTRKADKVKERAALQAAIDALKSEVSGAASFLQVVSRHQQTRHQQNKTKKHDTLDEERARRQLKVRKAVQLMLAQSKDKSQGLGDAREAVLGLVEAIEKHQEADEKRKSFCKTQQRTSEYTKVKLEGEIARINARESYLSTAVASIGQEVDSLKQEAESFMTQASELGALRSEERARYESESRERELTIRVVAKAKTILENFYKSEDPTALMQVDTSAPEEISFRSAGNNYCVDMAGQDAGSEGHQSVTTSDDCAKTCKDNGGCTGYEWWASGQNNSKCWTFPGSLFGVANVVPMKAAAGAGDAECFVKRVGYYLGSSRSGDMGSSVIMMLDTIDFDVRHEQAAAERANTQAEENAKKINEDAQENFNKKMAQAAQLLTKKAQDAQELSQIQADASLKKDSLKTTTESLEDLNKECTTLIANFADVLAERRKQIDQLKDVADILGGAKVGARTGMKTGLLQLQSLKA